MCGRPGRSCGSRSEAGIRERGTGNGKAGDSGILTLVHEVRCPRPEHRCECGFDPRIPRFSVPRSPFPDPRPKLTAAPQSVICAVPCGNSSVGRARPCQGRGREFESRFPLHVWVQRFFHRVDPSSGQGCTSPSNASGIRSKRDVRRRRQPVTVCRGRPYNVRRSPSQEKTSVRRGFFVFSGTRS